MVTCIIQAVLPIPIWNALFGISLDVDKNEKKEKDIEGSKRSAGAYSWRLAMQSLNGDRVTFTNISHACATKRLAFR